MRCFKEEKIQEYFNDAVIVTTRKHFYYMSAEEKRMHKIKMASQGFEDDFLIRFAIELLLFSKNIIFIRKKSQK